MFNKGEHMSSLQRILSLSGKVVDDAFESSHLKSSWSGSPLNRGLYLIKVLQVIL